MKVNDDGLTVDAERLFAGLDDRKALVVLGLEVEEEEAC